MSTPTAPTIVVLPQSRRDGAPFDPIKACEGYLAGFETGGRTEASPSYLHGWLLGCLEAGRARDNSRRKRASSERDWLVVSSI